MKVVVTGRCPFKAGQRLRCVVPVPNLLVEDAIYTVTDWADLGPPTALVCLREVPDVLFHPRRFVRAKGL